MSRAFLVAVSVLFLAAGCTHTDAPPAATAAPKTVNAPAAPLTPPLLNNPADRRYTGAGVNGPDCQQQCERESNLCLDSQAARTDITSGTMYESRLFGPASRCDEGLKSCLKRCRANASKK